MGDVKMVDLVAHLLRQREFSLRTFGPGQRLAGLLKHIQKELVEIERKPTDIEEWIDLVLLAFDGAWRAGHEPGEIAQALLSKQSKNEGRTWPDWRTAADGEPIEHVRAESESAAAKPLTTAEVEMRRLEGGVIPGEPGPVRGVSWDELLATTRALEAEIARGASIAATFDELSSGYLARAEKAERQLDCGQDGPVCAGAVPGCLRHNLKYQSELVAQRDEARTRKAEWQASAEAAQADVERLVREKAELVEALEGFVELGEGCPACGMEGRAGCGCRQEQGRAALAKAKGGG